MSSTINSIKPEQGDSSSDPSTPFNTGVENPQSPVVPGGREIGMSRRDFLKLATFTALGFTAGKFTPPINELRDYVPSIIGDTLSIEKAPRIIEFESIRSYNEYVAQKERDRGWSERDADEPFGDYFKAERVKLRKDSGGNSERTLGFVVSKKFISDLEEKQISPAKFFKGHLEVLNTLYEKAGVNLRYSIEDIAVFSDIFLDDHSEVKHIHQRGVEVKPGALINYPRYQDTTWVLTSSSNSINDHNYGDYLTNSGGRGSVVDIEGIPIDTGLIHELIHHTGLGDLYRGDIEFAQNLNEVFKGFRVDKEGYMASGLREKISLIEAFFLNKLIENGTYSPQHDGDEDVIRVISNRSRKRYYEFCPPHLGFRLTDSTGTPIDIHGVFTYAPKSDGTGAEAVSGGRAMYPHPEQRNFVRQPWKTEREALRQAGLPANNIQISANERVILPLDEHTMSFIDFIHQHPDWVDLEVRVYREAIDFMQKMVDHAFKDRLVFDVVKREEGFPASINGKVVYALFEINDYYRGVYYFETVTDLNMFEEAVSDNP